MMFKVLPLLCLLALCYCQDGPTETPQAEGDLDSILEQIFGSQSTDQTPPPEADGKPENPRSRRAGVVATTGNEKCKTTDGKDGECVVYFLCNAPESPDMHYFEDSCTSYTDVCCEKENITTRPPEPTKET